MKAPLRRGFLLAARQLQRFGATPGATSTAARASQGGGPRQRPARPARQAGHVEFGSSGAGFLRAGDLRRRWAAIKDPKRRRGLAVAPGAQRNRRNCTATRSTVLVSHAK